MIRRELVTFLIVGLITVLLDYISYTALYYFGILNISYAKAGGFLCGTFFAYFANRIWTFEHKKSTSRSAFLFIILYASTLGVNVAINSFALFLFKSSSSSVLVAFIVATGVSSCLNFIGMKFFVFKHSLP